MKFRLKDAKGNLVAEKKFVKSPVIIGRLDANDLVIASPSISRRHLQVEWQDQQVTLTDLGATNGSFINEQKITIQSTAIPCNIKLATTHYLEIEDDSIESVKAMDPPVLRNDLPDAQPPVPMVVINKHWQLLKDLSLKKVFLLCYIINGLLALFERLAGQPLYFNLGKIIIGPLAMALGALVISALVALLGLIGRKSYDIKPLFIVLMFIFLVGNISLAISPFILHPWLKVIAKGLVLGLTMITALASSFMILLTVFPHRWQLTLKIVAAAIAFLSIFFSDGFKRSHEFAQMMFEDNERLHIIKMIGGKNLSPAEVGTEIEKLANP